MIEISPWTKISYKLSYRHAVRGTRKGQWEKRPAYPKASKVVGKTPSIPQGEQGSGEKRPAYPKASKAVGKTPSIPKASKAVGETPSIPKASKD